MAQVVKDGDKVKVHYTGKIDGDTVFDSTEGKDPFEFVIGSENVIKGLSDSVVGMEVGSKKTVEITSEEAFGEYNDKLLVEVAADQMPEGSEIGDVLDDSETGMRWIVRELTEEKCVLDGNHILAGKVLFFDLELMSIEAE